MRERDGRELKGGELEGGREGGRKRERERERKRKRKRGHRMPSTRSVTLLREVRSPSPRDAE